MNVLWIVNMVFPAAAKEIGISTSSSGTWLLDLADRLSASGEVKLSVMTYYAGPFRDLEVNGIRYLLFPGGGKRLLLDNKKTIDDCKQAVELCKPDLIHIHGTEYAPGLAMLKAAPEIPSLLTIQGILCRIADEYFGGLSVGTLLKMTSFKSFIKMKTPFISKLLYIRNAKREAEVLKRVKYVTGRTDWDKSTMLSINPQLKYYRCNYNLPDAFYKSEKWSVEKMQRHTIATGAALYSLKGLHILIKALAIVKKKYPDVKLYIPGGKAANNRITRPSDYIRYIEKMIKQYDLDDNVIFTGTLSSQEVASLLAKSNVCVVPSAIEGASATLREASMIGTPSICSYRGGMTDLITDKVNGFTYDFPEYPQLALRITELFEDDELCETFSQRSMEISDIRHDRERNPREMIEVYKEVLNNE